MRHSVRALFHSRAHTQSIDESYGLELPLVSCIKAIMDLYLDSTGKYKYRVEANDWLAEQTLTLANQSNQ